MSFSPTAMRAAMRSVTGKGNAEDGMGRGRRRDKQKQSATAALQPPSSPSMLTPSPPLAHPLQASELSPMRRRVSVSIGLSFRRPISRPVPGQDRVATDAQIAPRPSAIQDTATPPAATRYLPRRLMRRGSSSLSPRSLRDAMNIAREKNNINPSYPKHSRSPAAKSNSYDDQSCSPQQPGLTAARSRAAVGSSPAAGSSLPETPPERSTPMGEAPRRSQRRRFSASLSPSSSRVSRRWSARGFGDKANNNRGLDAAAVAATAATAAAAAAAGTRGNAAESSSATSIITSDRNDANSTNDVGVGASPKRSRRRSMSLGLPGPMNLGLPLPLSSPSNAASRGDRPAGPGFRERLRQRAGGAGEGKPRIRSLSPPSAHGGRRGTIWMGSELLAFDPTQTGAGGAAAGAAGEGVGVGVNMGKTPSLLEAVPSSKRLNVLKGLHER